MFSKAPFDDGRRSAGWLLVAMLGLGVHVSGTGAPVTASRDQPFVNSLGMKFVPVPGTPVLFSVWETRVQDFEVFVAETSHEATEGTYSLGTNRWKQTGDHWRSPGFPQTGRHPVCGVSWKDANAFCEWLSNKEGRTYRLPTDSEWSLAAGIPGEFGATPKERSGKIPGLYPWGEALPPNVSGLPAGNYPGAEAAETQWPESFRVIENFRDPFPRTAPVGSFDPNAHGLYDIGGNVWEWCMDPFEPGKEHRTVRGASWVDNLPDILLSTYRHYGRPELRNTSVGFRIVLAPEPPQDPPSEP
ncbi:MAG: SUMF1/EgtB/PvdO family nonheme iron enzyme [Verrucomicrobiae bacterium]|nr:SUMF1/EgtB/PvdO family nonheme iron enzyme [Verrucomicrobiae bacterium]